MRQEKKTRLKGARIMNFRAKAHTWYDIHCSNARVIVHVRTKYMEKSRGKIKQTRLWESEEGENGILRGLRKR